MNGGHLVYIFNQTLSDMEPLEYLNPNNLKTSPKILKIIKDGQRGIFKLVGVHKVQMRIVK